MIKALAALLLAASLAGCATTGDLRAPTEVTRYHLGGVIAPGSVMIEPAPGSAGDPAFARYADAVAAELGRLGFAPGGGADADVIAVVSLRQGSAGFIRRRPAFSIGIGGGSYGGGGGIGGGVSTGIGGGRREVIRAELAVQLKRRRDGTIMWDGRAIRDRLAGPAGVDDAPALAAALFKGFPGESGITISVP